MGRRSVSTTKSGKFMNPTDQARKEARKKELKKNKKQRLLVRTAVLKGKDPGMIIQELDKLDEIEYDPVNPPPLAEKVLKDKRKKLRETLDRVMKLYQKEDPTTWSELRNIENDYERRRFHRIQYFEAVKQAESIDVEDIPLPSSDAPSIGDIPLPDEPTREPSSILKKTMLNVDTDAPGVPPGPPVDLSSDEEEEPEPAAKVSSEAQKTEGDGGQRKSVHFDDLDKFMKEVEEEFKTIEEDLQPPGTDKIPSFTPVAAAAASASSDTSSVSVPPPPSQPGGDEIGLPPQPQPPMIPAGIPAPNRIQFYGQHPPPPPAGPPMAPPGIGYPRVRVPPPYRMPQPPMGNRPPYGYPPSRPRFRPAMYTGTPAAQQQGQQRQGEVISAKPQIRNLSADVTRFVPVAVKTHKASGQETGRSHSAAISKPQPAPVQQAGPSKDDAYADFMKEMQGLL